MIDIRVKNEVSERGGGGGIRVRREEEYLWKIIREVMGYIFIFWGLR